MQELFPDLDVERIPPQAVRLLELTAEPMADGLRIRTHLALTPFQKSPLIELILYTPGGETCGGASIVEPIVWTLDVTLHIRTQKPEVGSYSLIAILSYPELEEVDRRSVEFTVPPETQT